MGAVIDVKNPLEVRLAGLQALTNALGPEGMRAFMRQSIHRTGDFTAEKYDQPEESMEDIAAELRRITAEHLLGVADDMASGRLAGKVVI